MDEPLLALVSASATGVLGEYDHGFSVDADEEFVILYGPNGVGKTKFLEIIDALTRLSGSALSLLPFESASLKYLDGSELSARRLPGDGPPGEPIGSRLPIRLSLKRPRERMVTWDYQEDGFEAWAKANLPYEQMSDSMWRDPNDGEIVHVDELRERYGRLGFKVEDRWKIPDALPAFTANVPSFLIETQRLRIELSRTRPARATYGPGRSPRHPRSRITEQAEKIRSLVNDAQTEHSRITQQLDRTFPNRVLGADASDLDSDSIRDRYNEQNDFRSRLGRVASVALDAELSLPEGELEDWALKLLNLYLDDTDQKLAPFEDLLRKIELLEQIINDRLLDKRLQVTDGEGLSVRHSVTDRSIVLDSLSSGEQHEIILMIDLLFSVPRGAVVLIDEPEISLHVAWQLAFIPDVKRIAKLAGFRFVVATHSPQIINDEWDRAIRLGPPEAAFS
jgi:ABC-type lipoprotein export system ATPase subunit